MKYNYEEFSKEDLINWIELCNDVFDKKGIKSKECGALYSVYGRLSIYDKEVTSRIAALEAALVEAREVVKPFAEAYTFDEKSATVDAFSRAAEWLKKQEASA